MRLWRISNYAHLSGSGGLVEAARWHERGRRIVYLADSPASALVEVLVHLEIEDEVPTQYQLMGIDVPEELAFRAIDLGDLTVDWRENLEQTRKLGNQWLAANETALMRVPSAVVPYTYNWLLNPTHSEAKRCVIATITRERFDRRLFQ
jgi:RES domain-containing protein